MTQRFQRRLNLFIICLFFTAILGLEKSSYENCGGEYEDGRCKWCTEPYQWYQPPSPPLGPLFRSGFCVKCENRETQEKYNGWCFCRKDYAANMSSWNRIEIDSNGNMLCLDIEKQCGGMMNFPLYLLGTGKHQIMICNATKTIENGARNISMSDGDKESFINQTLYQGVLQQFVNDITLRWSLEEGVMGSFNMTVPKMLRKYDMELDVFLLDTAERVIPDFNPDRSEKHSDYITYTAKILLSNFQNSQKFNCEHSSTQQQGKIVCRGALFAYPTKKIDSLLNVSISDEAVHKDLRKNNLTQLFNYSLSESYFSWKFNLTFTYSISSNTPLNTSIKTLVQEIPCSDCVVQVNYIVSSKMCKTEAACLDQNREAETQFAFGEDAFIYLNSTPSDNFIGIHEVWAVDDQSIGFNITKYVTTVEKSREKGKLLLKISMALPASEMGTSFTIKIIVKLITENKARALETLRKRSLAEPLAKAQVAIANVQYQSQKTAQVPTVLETPGISGTAVWVIIALLAVALCFLGLFVWSSISVMRRMNEKIRFIGENISMIEQPARPTAANPGGLGTSTVV